MSRRHRESHPTRDPKVDRRADHRRTRHSVSQALHEAADLEAVVLQEPKPPERPRQPPAPRGLRHWKQKAWKRRSVRRAQRNAAWVDLT